MQTNDRFLTAEGLERTKKELDYLRNVRRAEVAEMIREAREGGDISESAAYEDAKQQQAFVEGQISDYERLLKEAVVIEHQNTGVVSLGSKVTVEIAHGKKMQYVIVGSHEARPREGRISNESPVGKALLSRSTGEKVTVTTPGGKADYKIVKVE
jgi:transcription elongation factor GreA